MSRKKKMSAEGAELLEAVRQMKAGRKGRVYTPEQLLAISARRAGEPRRSSHPREVL